MKVFVVAMSAPAAKRQVEQVGIAGDVTRVILEPLAAVGLFALDLPLDEDAPGAVEHGDPLGEDGFESRAGVLHSCSVLPRENGASLGRTGSLGV